jgi:hypothetical protein
MNLFECATAIWWNENVTDSMAMKLTLVILQIFSIVNYEKWLLTRRVVKHS